MNRKQIAVLALPIIAIGVLFGYSLAVGIPSGFDTPSLDFPIEETDRIERISAYHTPDWGETGVFHNGIDLVISDNVTIISPVRGTVVAYGEQINPYAGNVLFDITIAINWGWEAHLTIEPGFRDESNNTLQSTLINAHPPQQVSPGDELATLLFSENYPHLHFMLLNLGADVCAYNYSTPAAAPVFDTIATESNSTILYPYTQTSPLLAPYGLIMIGATSIFCIVVLIVFRPRR